MNGVWYLPIRTRILKEYGSIIWCKGPHTSRVVLVSGSVFVLRRTLSLSGNIRVLTRLGNSACKAPYTSWYWTARNESLGIAWLRFHGTRHVRRNTRLTFLRTRRAGCCTRHGITWYVSYHGVKISGYCRLIFPDIIYPINNHVLSLCLKLWSRVFQNVRRWQFKVITTQDKVSTYTVLLLRQTV